MLWSTCAQDPLDKRNYFPLQLMQLMQVWKLNEVRIQNINIRSLGHRLTCYQEVSGLRREITRLDDFNEYVIAFGVGTVLVGICGVCFSPTQVLVSTD